MNANDLDSEYASAPPPPTSIGEPLYPGDVGELQEETRRVYATLLLGPSLEGRDNPNLWPVLVRDQAKIRSRLADLFLELVMDMESKVAFTRQADTNDIAAPRLLRKTSLTFIESVLLLYLRQMLTQADRQGERAVISKVEITEHLMVYAPRDANDPSSFAKRINAAIENAKKFSLLHKIPAAEERWEISSALKLLFSAEDVVSLTAIYNVRQDGATSADTGDGQERGDV